MSKKWWLGFLLFYLDPELFAKIKKDMVSAHSQKSVFLHFGRYEPCIAKSTKLDDSWSSSKFSIFQANSLVTRK